MYLELNEFTREMRTRQLLVNLSTVVMVEPSNSETSLLTSSKNPGGHSPETKHVRETYRAILEGLPQNFIAVTRMLRQNETRPAAINLECIMSLSSAPNDTGSILDFGIGSGHQIHLKESFDDLKRALASVAAVASPTRSHRAVAPRSDLAPAVGK